MRRFTSLMSGLGLIFLAVSVVVCIYFSIVDHDRVWTGDAVAFTINGTPIAVCSGPRLKSFTFLHNGINLECQ